MLPRASSGISYGLVTIAYLWQLFGALLGAPSWLVGLSPFHQVGSVPAQPFKAVAAAVMVGLAGIVVLVALGTFQRRDLIGN